LSHIRDDVDGLVDEGVGVVAIRLVRSRHSCGAVAGGREELT
jgi:hypothetical protein